VLLGYSCLDPYTKAGPFIGQTIGRFSNRIGGARFALGGKTYHLEKNEGENMLHAGRRGFGFRLWKATPYEDQGGVFVRFDLDCADGNAGFPGNLHATVTYGLSGDNIISADYAAKLDAPCPLSFTNHAYYNLAGEGSATILGHEARLYSSAYLEIDRACIPTGKIVPVAGTPFDFTAPKSIGSDAAGGYDHCFVLDGEPGVLRPAAEMYEPVSGRMMKVSTTQPGLQFYTGIKLTGTHGKAGSVYGRESGFCVETQHFPDSPNKPEFPSAIFGPDRPYHEQAVFEFRMYA
jgi:aldose 1-epimerase